LRIGLGEGSDLHRYRQNRREDRDREERVMESFVDFSILFDSDRGQGCRSRLPSPRIRVAGALQFREATGKR